MPRKLLNYATNSPACTNFVYLLAKISSPGSPANSLLQFTGKRMSGVLLNGLLCS